MKIQIFDGGQVSKPRPQYLELNQAVRYENIDNSLRSLVPVKTKVDTQLPAKDFNYYFDIAGIWFLSDVRRDYVSFQGELYYTDGIQPKVYMSNGDLANIGLNQPVLKPELVASSVVEPVKNIRFDTGLSGDLPLEKTYYKFVNDNGDYYSKVFNASIDVSNSRAELLDKNFNEIVEQINPVTDATGSVVITPPEGVEYGTSGIRVFRQYKDKWHLVGTFTDPGVGPIVSVTDDVHDISDNEVLDETKIVPVDGTVQYVYTFYSTSTGLESATSPISDEIEAEGIVTISNIEDPNDFRVDKVRVYRVGGNLTSFTLIKEILVGELPIGTVVDAVRDIDAIGDILSSTLNTPAPADLKFITEMNAMLFGAEGSQLRFTPIGKPEYWPEVYSIEFYTEIVAIGACGSGLLVCTSDKTYIVYGTGPTLLAQQLLDGEQGCVSNASMQQVGSALMWLSKDGICVSNGGPVKVITQQALGKISFDVKDSVVIDQVYYLLDTSGTILAHDYRFQPIFKYLELGITGITRDTDKLYGVAPSQVEDTLHTLFSGNTYEDMHYMSPRFVEGRITEDKTYKKVYVYSKGDIIINIFINDSLVLTKSLSGEDSHQIQVPQSKQRGSFIQFELSGKGEVYEIEYEVGRGIGHG